MIHEIKRTKGFVLSSYTHKESDKIFFIFTKDFGLIRAQGIGIRKLESKLRYNLQNFYAVYLDLVRGREIWRVTHATRVLSVEKIIKNHAKFLFLNNFFRLIRRLIPEEEVNSKLFSHITEVYKMLSKENFSPNDIKDFECVSVLRLLHHLGYIGGGIDMSIFVTSVLSKPILAKVSSNRQLLVSHINKSIKESHL